MVVGGTRQHDDFGQDIRAKDSEDVWQRAVRVVPSLQVSFSKNERIPLFQGFPTVQSVSPRFGFEAWSSQASEWLVVKLEMTQWT